MSENPTPFYYSDKNGYSCYIHPEFKHQSTKHFEFQDVSDYAQRRAPTPTFYSKL